MQAAGPDSAVVAGETVRLRFSVKGYDALDSWEIYWTGRQVGLMLPCYPLCLHATAWKTAQIHYLICVCLHHNHKMELAICYSIHLLHGCRNRLVVQLQCNSFLTSHTCLTSKQARF